MICTPTSSFEILLNCSESASIDPSTSPLIIIGKFLIAPSLIKADIASKDCAVIFLRSISRFKRCLSDTILFISFSFSTTAKISADCGTWSNPRIWTGDDG